MFDVDLPLKSDLVSYFYNPFGPPVITQVAARLVTHHELHGYRIIIIYHDARHREVFENTKKFAILDETKNTVTWATLPQAGPDVANPS